MAKQPAGLREFIRKRIVSLKRKPQTIALLVFVVAFVYSSLNLTKVSNTTAKIQGTGMGLAGFATMLFSSLSIVCSLNAFVELYAEYKLDGVVHFEKTGSQPSSTVETDSGSSENASTLG